jgi:hypothetical protein
MLQRSKITEELLKKPDCFALLTQIALRAKRSDDFNLQNLKIGESFIGDYQRAGLSEQRYRTAKNNLSKWGFVTFKATNKGTVAKLTDARVYNINENEINGQTNEQPTNKPTDQQRTTNEQPTTKKNYNNLIIKEDKNIDAEFENFWNSYKPIHTQKGSKQKAQEAFIQALKNDSIENITKGLNDYMADCHNKGTYTKMVDGWLKEMMWQGEYGGVAQPELTDAEKLKHKTNHDERLRTWVGTIIAWINDRNPEILFLNKYKNPDNQPIINIIDQYAKKATTDEEITKLGRWLKDKYESNKENFKTKLKQIANEQNPYSPD